MQLKKRELDYALQQLAKRVGVNPNSDDQDPFENSPVKIMYTPQSPTVNEKIKEKTIIILAVDDEAFEKFIQLPERSIEFIDKNDLLPKQSLIAISKQIPILFPSGFDHNGKKLVELKENSVVINFDIVAATFFMLSRYEEYKISSKDKFDRFPIEKSSAFRQGFLLQPVVDEYAMILRAWIRFLKPGWEPEIRSGKILLTHDIDFIRTLPNLRKVVRSMGRKIKSDGLLNGVNDVIKVWHNERKDPSSSKYLQSISSLCDLSEENGLESIFFFKACKPGFYDSGYDINQKALKPVINKILDRDFGIGLHPSFHSYQNEKRIRDEKLSLENAINKKITECRQHYLRFKVPVTWDKQIKAGIKVDNSLSHAEHVGFRCGTCHPFEPFDILTQQVLNITERPLVVMDTSLRDYMDLSINEAKLLVLKLAKLCANVEGDFTILWHNTSFFDSWFEWGKLYKSLLRELAK
jgi:hypothetical protein